MYKSNPRRLGRLARLPSLHYMWLYLQWVHIHVSTSWNTFLPAIDSWRHHWIPWSMMRMDPPESNFESKETAISFTLLFGGNGIHSLNQIWKILQLHMLNTFDSHWLQRLMWSQIMALQNTHVECMYLRESLHLKPCYEYIFITHTHLGAKSCSHKALFPT